MMAGLRRNITLWRQPLSIGVRSEDGYGITETSGITTVLRAEGSTEIIEKAGSAGQPVPNITIEIRDDAGRSLEAGQVGEVIITGPRVMNGYWNKQGETDRVIIEGAYHTGDLGRLDDNGNLTLVDRKKDMIISGGENVYSAEVENLISTAPGVAEVAVIGIPHATWGEAVHAIIVCREGTTLNEGELIAWCRGRIAGYKIPKSITFSNEPLPKTGPGKIAKGRLLRGLWRSASSSNGQRLTLPVRGQGPYDHPRCFRRLKRPRNAI
jgi:long-chain acyl-CoA synthetase